MLFIVLENMFSNGTGLDAPSSPPRAPTLGTGLKQGYPKTTEMVIPVCGWIQVVLKCSKHSRQACG